MWLHSNYPVCVHKLISPTTRRFRCCPCSSLCYFVRACTPEACAWPETLSTHWAGISTILDSGNRESRNPL